MNQITKELISGLEQISILAELVTFEENAELAKIKAVANRLLSLVASREDQEC